MDLVGYNWGIVADSSISAWRSVDEKTDLTTVSYWVILKLMVPADTVDNAPNSENIPLKTLSLAGTP